MTLRSAGPNRHRRFAPLGIVLLALTGVSGPAEAADPETSTTAAASTGPTHPEATTSGVVDAAELDAAFEADEDEALGGYDPSLGQSFLEMMLVLGFVALLAYLLLAKLLPRLARLPVPTSRQRILTIVDRLPVDTRASLLIVKMGEQHFLVGHSEHGLSLLARLESADVSEALAAAHAQVPPTPWEGLSSLLGRRSSEPTP